LQQETTGNLDELNLTESFSAVKLLMLQLWGKRRFVTWQAGLTKNEKRDVFCLTGSNIFIL